MAPACLAALLAGPSGAELRVGPQFERFDEGLQEFGRYQIRRRCVAPGDPHLWSLRHEPALALTPRDDAGDGLADIERIVSGAPSHLPRGAWLLLEHGAAQAQAVREGLQRNGFPVPGTRTDLAGRERVTGAAYLP